MPVQFRLEWVSNLARNTQVQRPRVLIEDEIVIPGTLRATDDVVRKVLYLAINRVSKKWKRPIKDWAAALNYFTIVFEGRIPA